MNMRSYSCCLPSSRESKQIASLSSILKLVAEESRLKIMCLLRRGNYCVCELMRHLAMSQSLISHHLKDLKEAEMIVDNKRGLRVYYSLTKKGRQIINLLSRISKEVKI